MSDRGGNKSEQKVAPQTTIYLKSASVSEFVTDHITSLKVSNVMSLGYGILTLLLA